MAKLNKNRIKVKKDDGSYVELATVDDLAAVDTAGTGSETVASVKTKYESNSDTNAFTDAEKNAVANIGTGTLRNKDSIDDAILIDDGVVTEAKLSSDVQTKLNTTTSGLSDLKSARLGELDNFPLLKADDPAFDNAAGLKDIIERGLPNVKLKKGVYHSSEIDCTLTDDLELRLESGATILFDLCIANTEVGLTVNLNGKQLDIRKGVMDFDDKCKGGLILKETTYNETAKLKLGKGLLVKSCRNTVNSGKNIGILIRGRIKTTIDDLEVTDISRAAGAGTPLVDGTAAVVILTDGGAKHTRVPKVKNLTMRRITNEEVYDSSLNADTDGLVIFNIDRADDANTTEVETENAPISSDPDKTCVIENILAEDVMGRTIKGQLHQYFVNNVNIFYNKVTTCFGAPVQIGMQDSGVGTISNINIVYDAASVLTETGNDVFLDDYVVQPITIGTSRRFIRNYINTSINDMTVTVLGQSPTSGPKCLIGADSNVEIDTESMLAMNNIRLLSGKAMCMVLGPAAVNGTGSSVTFAMTNCEASELDACWYSSSGIKENTNVDLVNCVNHGPEVWATRRGTDDSRVWSPINAMHTRGLKAGLDAANSSKSSVTGSLIENMHPIADTQVGTHVNVFDANVGSTESTPYALILKEIDSVKSWEETDVRL